MSDYLAKYTVSIGRLEKIGNIVDGQNLYFPVRCELHKEEKFCNEKNKIYVKGC